MASIKKFLLNPSCIFAFLGISLVGISVYLTWHFYEVMFPTRLSMGQFCDISGFWNCDTAAFSPFGKFLDIPTSLFGIAFGLFIVLGALTRNVTILKTNYFVAILNLCSCAFLFVYSLVVLHGLCPGCTVYYVLSCLTVLAFMRMPTLRPRPALFVLVIYGVVMGMMMGATYLYNHGRMEQQTLRYEEWIKEFLASKIYDDHELDFSLPLEKSTDDFKKAPLRITIISDFQCPFCKLLERDIEKVIHRYRGKINIRYTFFPLDNACNTKSPSAIHPYACNAAKLSLCAKDQFKSIHDEIYDRQDHLNDEWLRKKADAFGVRSCYDDEQTMTRIKAIVAKAYNFSINAVPSLLINERKISGLMPIGTLFALLDALLKINND